MNDREINAETGGYINAASLDSVPGIEEAYKQLLSRVASLPFVPSSWLAKVAAARAENGNRLWMPRYAINAIAWRQEKDGPLLGDVPSWLSNDPAAARAWNTLADWWTERMQPILAGWARNQADIMNAANADARFWDTLYVITKPIADVGEAIIAAPEKAGEVISRSVLGALRGLLPVLLIGAVGVVGFLAYKSGAYKKIMKGQ